MPAILNRLSIDFKKLQYILHDLNNTKILLYKLFVQYLVVKPACVNAALDNFLINLKLFVVTVSSDK